MLDLTIRDIDETLEHDLRARALRNNRTIEEEARLVLRNGIESVRPPMATERSPEEVEALVRKLMSYGRKDPEPFDLKAFSDALSDGSE